MGSHIRDGSAIDYIAVRLPNHTSNWQLLSLFLRMVGKWKNIHIRIIDNNYGRYNHWSTIWNFES